MQYQILDVDPEGEEDGANRDLDSMRKGKCAVIKTSTRQTVFLPLIGLVPAEQLKPGDLIGVNKDSCLVLDTLPAEFEISLVSTRIPTWFLIHCPRNSIRLLKLWKLTNGRRKHTPTLVVLRSKLKNSLKPSYCQWSRRTSSRHSASNRPRDA